MHFYLLLINNKLIKTPIFLKLFNKNNKSHNQKLIRKDQME
jgi:hypothetical protein